MYFYEVWVRSAAYRGDRGLIYGSKKAHKPGVIVRAQLRETETLGIIIQKVKAPGFEAKELATLDLPPLPKELIELARWLKDYYASPIGPVTQLLLPDKLNPESLKSVESPTQEPLAPIKQPPLTTEQKLAISKLGKAGSYLLHGRTGSGKTRVYTEVARQALANNKSAIILTPEIGLTPQLASEISGQFGNRVVVLHSDLPARERRQAWLKILTSTQPLVVIGPRSALFCPLKNIGLIVIDEAHENTYKQESVPQYQASRVAAYLAQLHGAIFLLGTATPLVTDYFLAKQRERPIITMSQLPKASSKAKIVIGDMRDRGPVKESAYFTTPLLKAIRSALERHEQSLLYLNRRGTARLVVCESCGWHALCPHCHLPLTYHADIHILRCHVCGFRQVLPTDCPACSKPTITLKSIGTKAIVEEARRLFPKARLARFDGDNQKSERLAQQYANLRDGKIDILVGTQLLAKGLDLPLLSVVGVILADTSLYLPDFSAQERTYQLISQVIGRIGRGYRAGTAVIQTYNPKNSAISAAVSGDWQDFYSRELADRKRYKLPPYRYLLVLSCRRASVNAAERAAEGLKAKITAQYSTLQIEGPAPAFHEKVGNKYQWHIVVKSSTRPVLIQLIKELPYGWTFNIDPINLL